MSLTVWYDPERVEIGKKQTHSSLSMKIVFTLCMVHHASQLLGMGQTTRVVAQ